MIQIKTESNDIIVVEVPEDSENFELHDNDGITYDSKSLDSKENPWQFIDLEKGWYKILGKLSELDDKDLERFIENDNDGAFFGGFWEYTGPKNYVAKGTDWKICNSIKESFISLLQSNGIDTGKELLIIEVL